MRFARVAALLAFLPLAACNDQPDLPPPSPALWEVIGPDDTHGWLFGTVHSLPDGYDWRTPKFDAAFSDADILLVEVDIRQGLPDYFSDMITTHGLGRPSLRVDPAYRVRTAAAFVKAGLSEDDLVDTDSWAVALRLANQFSVGDDENGVDLALLRQRGKKPVIELEGYNGQLIVFDSLPRVEQVDLLESVALATDTAVKDGERQVLAWRSGDTAKIETDMKTGMLADPELREALLTRRNRSWAEQIDSMLQLGDDTFVAVGTAHLLGKEGLPALLAARGYTVKRVQ